MVFQKLSNINGGVDLKETFSEREREYKKYPKFEIYYHDHITVFFKMKDKKIK